jgi:hypothetical protein
MQKDGYPIHKKYRKQQNQDNKKDRKHLRPQKTLFDYFPACLTPLSVPMLLVWPTFDLCFCSHQTLVAAKNML